MFERHPSPPRGGRAALRWFLVLGLAMTRESDSLVPDPVADRGAGALERRLAWARTAFLPEEEDRPGSARMEGRSRRDGGPRGNPLSPEVPASGSAVPGTQSETSIAVFGDHVVVGFNQFNPAAPNQRSGVTYSADGGLTFTDTGGLPTGVGSNVLIGDPSVTACGDGKFYYASLYWPDFIPSQTRISVSPGTFSGNILSWGNPVVAVASTADFLDKDWLVCDRLTNRLYLAYTRFVDGNVGDSTSLSIEIIQSADGGATWSPPQVLESSATESIHVALVATGPQSEVYVMWERGIDDLSAANTRLEFRRSLNLGASFDPRVVVRTMVPSFFPASVGFDREDTLEIGNLAVDLSPGPHRGAIYAIWVEREATGWTRDVFGAVSEDQGTTWSAPMRINDDPPGNDQVMPSISVNAAGTVEAIWYDYRNWRGMHTVDLYAARSGGGTGGFSPNFRVTTAPTSWFAPLTLSPNFGDYIHCASEGTDFYPAWADGRNNNIDVYVSRIPTAACGDGNTDPFEECDDGNTLDGDSCSGACALTPCGNGILEGTEACDDGNIQGGDGCSQICRLEVCGDGIIQRNNQEGCDDGNTDSLDGCSATCQIELDRLAWIAEERSRLVLESITTGMTTVLGDPGFHELGDIAFDAAGKLFGATGSNPFLGIGFNGYLLEIAAEGLPARGSAIGPTGWTALNAIDFHPLTGILYGIAVDDSLASRLVTLDPATGATTAVIGDLGLNNARAMAFDAAGALYVSGRPGASGSGNLYFVNLAPFQVTLVGVLDPSISYQLSGMDFAPDGSLYGVVQRGTGKDRGLVLVNKSTGAGTVISTQGVLNQQGIRFAPAVAVDQDLDGIQNAADCAPQSAANPPPGPTSGLAFAGGLGPVLTWTPAANARFSNSYRGTITGPLGLRSPGARFDQVCFESSDAQGNGDAVSVDPAVPPVGTAYYYLSSGEGCSEGPLDTDPGHPIPNPSPCPTPP